MSEKIDATSLTDLKIDPDDKTFQQFLTEGNYIVEPHNDEIFKIFKDYLDL